MKWLISLFLLVSFSSAMAQEINCTVTLNYDKLDGTDRVNVTNLAPAIQKYINEYRWTGGNFKGPKIQVTLDIYLLSASGGVYNAQAFIGSQRPIYKSTNTSPMVRVLDNSWSFNYTKDQALYHDDYHFNSLTSFIDYYMYVVLGFDYDSYDPLGGTKYFQKASNIVTLAQTGDLTQGWGPGGSGTYSRYSLVNDVLSGSYDVFRKAFYEYQYNGIDLLSTEKDTAQATIASSLDKIANIVIQSGTRSTLIKVFFDAKYMEIAQALQGYKGAPAVLQKLSVVDQAHQSTYEKYLN